MNLLTDCQVRAIQRHLRCSRWTRKFTNGEVSITRKKDVYRGTFKLPICDGIINKKLDAQ